MERRSLDCGRVPVFGGQRGRRQSRTLEIRATSSRTLGIMLTDRKYSVQLTMESRCVHWLSRPQRNPPQRDVGGPQVNFTMGAKTGKQRDGTKDWDQHGSVDRRQREVNNNSRCSTSLL